MSENIFTELYNRVLSLFGQSAPKEENAKDVACNRLRVVLMQDRTNLTPELLQRMRKELVELLSKYSIPVVRAKDEAEIEEALKAEDDDSEEAEDDTSEDDENVEEDEVSEEQESEEEASQSDENAQEDECNDAADEKDSDAEQAKE